MPACNSATMYVNVFHKSDNTLMMQFCYLFLQKSTKLIKVQVFKTQRE